MRAFLAGPLIRLFPLGLVVLAIQRAVLSELPVFDVVLPLVLALAAGAGAGAGSERGAIAGLTLGSMYDLAVGTPLGSTGLVFGLAGFVAGYSFTLTPVPPWWLSSLFAAVGAAVGEVMTPVALALIGSDGWFDERLFTIAPVAFVFALLISPLTVVVGRWSVRAKRPQWTVPDA